MLHMVTLEDVVGAFGLGIAWCCGGIHGLWLAWTQPVRMQRWADRAVRLSSYLEEVEERGKNK